MINFLKKNYLLSALLLLLGLYISGFSSNQILLAATPTPTPSPTPVPVPSLPPLKIHAALGFNNIGAEDDFFVLIRYDLDIGTAPNEFWCNSPEYLLNDSGCELSPPNPQFPFSLIDGMIYIEYLDSSGVVHLQNSKIPRVSHGLVGIYGEAPSSSDFGFNSSLIPGEVCLRYNSDFFDPSGNGSWNCATVFNISGGAASLAREISGSEGILYDLENDMGLPLNSMVNSSGLVTPLGTTFLEEALQGIRRVAVDANGSSVFELGTTSPLENFTPVGTSNNFNNKISATAIASGSTENLQIISGEYLGVSSSGMTATLIFLILGITTGVAVLMSTGNPLLSLMATSVIMLPGMFIGGISVGFLFTIISIGIVIGSWYWIRRSPE